MSRNDRRIARYIGAGALLFAAYVVVPDGALWREMGAVLLGGLAYQVMPE